MFLDLETLLEEFGSRGSNLFELLTPKQRLVEDDDAWIRIICGGRQWGKTTWSAIGHIRNAIAGHTSLAIAPTVTKARDLLMPGVEWLNAACQAGIKYRASEWSFVTNDGARILCLGCNTVREAEKVRGHTPPFVSVEECGTYKPELLQFLVESCVTPSQVKWFGNGGRGLAMIGTPGLTVHDYWHRVCQGEFGGSVHHATVHDNPHIPNAEGYLEHVLKSYSWTPSTPRYRREYLGQFCAETDSMCYAGAWDQVVLPQSLAPSEGYTILGLDLGASRSPSAWVVFRITRELVGAELKWITHVIHAEKEMTLTVHDVAAKTGSLRKRFGIQRMRGDAGGLGELALNTLREKFHGLPIENAPKAGKKLGRIWLMASMLQIGTLRVYEGAAQLVEELLSVPWNDTHDDHHDSFPDHACDAAHYGIELVQQWTKEKEPAKPDYGSEEWRKQEMADYRKKALNRGQNDE